MQRKGKQQIDLFAYAVRLGLSEITEELPLKSILFVVPDLTYCGTNSQIALLASQLAHHYQTRILSLASCGPMKNRFTELGLQVDQLDARHAFDLSGIIRLRRQLAAEPPDVIHAWGRQPLRMLQVVGALSEFPVLLNNPPRWSKHARFSWLWDRSLINRCRFVVASSAAEYELLIGGGIDAANMEVITNAVESSQPEHCRQRSVTNSSHRAADRPYFLCVGPLFEHKGFLDAIWAYDILRRPCKSLRLRIVGEGPDLRRLRRFVHRLGIEDVVSFEERCPNIVRLIDEAEAVWVPSSHFGGRQVVLEAMARGKNVVATDIPELADIVRDGQTGLCVPAGKPVELAKRTADLLASPSQRVALKDAAMEYVKTSHDLEKIAGHFVHLYQSAAA